MSARRAVAAWLGRAGSAVAGVARDAYALSMWVGFALLLGGFLAIALAWSGAAALLLVPLQIPYIVSGGFAGLGLIALGLTVLNVQSGRRISADRRRRMDLVLREATETLDRLRGAA